MGNSLSVHSARTVSTVRACTVFTNVTSRSDPPIVRSREFYFFDDVMRTARNGGESVEEDGCKNDLLYLSPPKRKR